MAVSKTSILAGGLFLALVSLSRAQAPAAKPADPVADPSAKAWVEQLGDADYRKRDEATRALERLADKALSALRAGRKHADPEVRRRANELATAVEAATLLAPRRVTLELKQKSAREVVAELAKRTSYKIECWGGTEEAKYDFAWKDVPFWQALDQLCQGAGLAVQPSYGDETLRLQAQQRYAPYVCRDGAFRFAAGSFQHVRSVDFATLASKNPEARRSDSLSFSFTVHAEPRLPLLGLGEVKLTAAYDSEGTSLVPSAAPADGAADPLVPRRGVAHYYGGGKSLSIPAELPLGHPSPRARSVKLLRGTVPVTVLVEQRPAVVSDKLAKGLKTKVGTTTFLIEDVSETPAKQAQLKMTVTEDGAGNDSSWTNSLYNRLEVYDEKGQRMVNYGSSWSHSGGNQVQITFTYGAAGANKLGTPTKLVYQVWTTMQHQVGFEFKDLPLP